MKKLIVLLLVLMLAGCTGIGNVSKVEDIHAEYDRIGVEYLKKLENYEVRKKSTSNTDNEEFDEFLNSIFVDAMEDSYVNMHFTVVDYKSFGIEKPDVEWGEAEYGNMDHIDDYLKQLDELQKFDFDSLSNRQQYDYEALEYSLYESIALGCFERYSLLFSGGTDILSNIVSNLSDFSFYDKESLDDYVILINDTGNYLDSALEYTAQQAKEGIYLTDYSINQAIDYIDGFVSYQDDNAIIVATSRSIDALDFLSASEKESYKKEIKDAVKNVVIPAYNKVKEELNAYYGKTTDEKNALVSLNPDYALIKYYLAASDNSPIDEIYNDGREIMDRILDNAIVAVNDENYDILVSELDAIDYGEIGVFGRDYQTILDYLMDNLKAYYPDLGVVDYNVEDLSGSAGSDNILAYYYRAPIDDLNQNIIRVNPETMSTDPIETFTTLSHEGFPGHLYQHVYYHQSEPSTMRSVIGFSGYTEGYAIQAEDDALHFSGIENWQTIDYLLYTTVYPYIVLSCADLGVNYYGWSLDELKSYIEETSYYDPSASDIIYQMMVDMPGTYCYYGLGYVNFQKLREKAMAWQSGMDFDCIEYNRVILSNGELPFNILEGAVKEYYSSK